MLKRAENRWFLRITRGTTSELYDQLRKITNQPCKRHRIWKSTLQSKGWNCNSHFFPSTPDGNPKAELKSNLSLYSLYYAEACNELAGPISASLRWQAVGNCVGFDRPKIWTSHLPLQRRTRYSSNNWPVKLELDSLTAVTRILITCKYLLTLILSTILWRVKFFLQPIKKCSQTQS